MHRLGKLFAIALTAVTLLTLADPASAQQESPDRGSETSGWNAAAHAHVAPAVESLLDEVVCSQCSEACVGIGGGEQSCVHKFPNGRSEEGCDDPPEEEPLPQSGPAPDRERRVALNLTVCAACGGTSECHTEDQDGPCHVDCDGGPTLQDDVVQAFVSNDRVAMARILIVHEEYVQVNTARSAIQVLDCRGHVAVHLPLADDFLTALSAPAQQAP